MTSEETAGAGVGRRRFLAGSAVAGAAIWTTPSIARAQTAGGASPTPSAPEVLRFTPGASLEGSAHQSFTLFTGCTGREVVEVTEIPSNLSTGRTLLFNFNGALLTTAQYDAVNAFLAAGGTVVSVADHAGFPAQITFQNTLSDAIGSSIDTLFETFDPAQQVTTDILSDPLTVGVSSINYHTSSGLTVAGSARALVRGNSGQVMVAAQQVGAGQYVTFTDLSIVTDGHPNGYTTYDNCALVTNTFG